MKWKSYVKEYQSGQITGLEMVNFLTRHILKRPHDEEDVLNFIEQHPNEDIAKRAVTIREWVAESRDAQRKLDATDSSKD